MPIKKMKIIEIEGLDKAGKKTATDVLEQYFKGKGFKVARESMPNYSTPIGKLIRDWLTGKCKADTKTFEFLQAADKQHMQTIMQEHEDNGVEILLIDRYVHSMLAYGAYDNDLEWMYEITKYMRRPDDVIYLDVEPEVSMHRRGKFGDNDKYEDDVERLRATRQTYLDIFETEKDTNVYKIDANKPELIVKMSVFDIATKMYEKYTGMEEEPSRIPAKSRIKERVKRA